MRCGHDNHLTGEKCPATDAICHKFGKKGHFSAYYFTKPLHAVSTGNTEEKASSFLGTMTEDSKDSWYIDIQMRQRVITFKIDTSAKVTAINGKTHQLIGKLKLSNPSKVLYGPVNQTLDVMGQFSGCLKYGKHSLQETVYVVKGFKTNLLGLSAITALQLIQRVYATYANSDFWQIPLSDTFRPLTMFITPFGRYHFNKLPFGISYAPELSQRRMNTFLEGLEGMVCLMDDVLILVLTKMNMIPG